MFKLSKPVFSSVLLGAAFDQLLTVVLHRGENCVFNYFAFETPFRLAA